METDNTPINNQKNSGVFKSLIYIIIIIAVSLFSYRLGKSSYTKEAFPPLPTNSPKIYIQAASPTPTPYTDENISYAKIDNQIYLQYKGKIYKEDPTGSFGTPIETNIANDTNSQWKKIVTRPANIEGFDEIFSFRVFPDNKHFLMIPRWQTITDDKFSWNFRVFYYNLENETLTNPITFDTAKTQTKEYLVPKISQISPDNKYVALSMFGCWNCGAGQPQTLLLDPQTGRSQNIGIVSFLDFKWGENGNYQYKEYKVKECEQPQPGECFEDPKTLPLLFGKF